MEFTPEICPHCCQTTDYKIDLDRGSAHIVIAIANAHRRTGHKRIHVTNEMLGLTKDFRSPYEMVMDGYMSAAMLQNILRPKYFGLIAQGEDPGYYLLTKKGSKFLRGETVNRSAVVDKLTHSKKLYLEDAGMITIGELLKSSSIFFWEGEKAKLEKLAAYLDQEMTEPKLF